MNWERQLLREQIGAGALSKTLAPYEFLAESGVFITQAGHVAAVLQMEPVPFECSRIDQVTRTAAHLLTTALTSLIDNLNGVARLEILSDQKAFLFMRRLLNYAPEISDSQILHRAWDLNWQLADSSIECDGPLKVDRYFVRVLTLKEPPQQRLARLSSCS